MRIALASVVVSAALVVFFLAKYLLDAPALRRATLEVQSVAIAQAIRSGTDPARDDLYKEYPRNYGFRVFDHRRARDRHVVSEANPGLLPPDDPGTEADLTEGVFDLGATSPEGTHDRWLMIDRDELGGRTVWIQVVMVGDPAWLWSGVIGTELIDHVFVPVISIVPLLTLAILLTVRQALRPLSPLAAQAEALGRAAMRGQPLQALPEGGLPREFRELVGALNTMLDALGRVLAEQREFAADAAHELRTPLAVMALQLAELPRGPAADQLQRELADLGRLVGQLLRFAQAENAMLSGQVTVDLCAIGRAVCEDMAQSATAGGRALAYFAADRPVLIEGNSELIGIALRNLIDNALGVSPTAETVEVHVTAHGVVTVMDRGPGISDANKSRIFQRFWRGEGHGRGSAGIGLALIRKIMDLHGGTVFVHDRDGGGSCFVLDFFPLRDASGQRHVRQSS